jgi:hypothetical protein
VLADDWTCIQSGPVDHIRFWFSSYEDWFMVGPPIDEILNIHVSIHDNIPDYDYEGPLYSMPGEVLWEADFPPYAPEVTFTECGFGPQGWYDPMTGEYLPDNHYLIFECSIENIDFPFLQTEGEVYWLDISIETLMWPLGWKTADMMRYPADYRGRHYMDDAVWADVSMFEWFNLIYPGGPYMGESLDLAFTVGAMPQVCCDGRWGPSEWCGQDCYQDFGGADMTHDCITDLMDYYLLCGDYGLSAPCLSGDYDASGTVDLYDLLIFNTNYNLPVTPCIPADEVILGGPAGQLSLSFSSDPANIVTALYGPAPGAFYPVYVVARDLPSPLGATEFGILTSHPEYVLSDFIWLPPFNLDMGSGLTDIVLGAPGEVSGPVTMGYFNFLYMGDMRVTFDLVPNMTYGGLRWISPSSNVYHDWAVASSAFIYLDPGAEVEPQDRPEEFRLYAGAPNPFGSATVIRYDLPRDDRVRLTVYDVAGKAVRTLVDLPLQQAGQHTATWDGSDDAGAPVAPGVYFYRLETSRYSATERMTLLR